VLLVELKPADGPRVWSECVAFERPNYSSETHDTAWIALRDYIAPRVLDVTLDGPGRVHGILEKDFRGHRMAKAAVEMAVWTVAAERQGVSLARQLGGERDRIPVGISLGIQSSPAALVEKASAAIAAGYRKIKIKIGPGEDIEYVAAVRAALPQAPLMVDANNAYTLDDADHLARLDAFDLIMIEQPLEHEDLVRHAALQRKLRTPVCLDESITSVNRAEDMIELGSGRIVNIKPGRVGGFSSSLAIHDLCVQHAIPVWCGGMLESGIGRAYNVALATLPGFTIAGDLSPSARYWERDIVTPEWTLDADGMMRVPVDRPGIGVTVAEDRIEDMTVRRETIDAR
ncbi:MAG: o-succinylbenzoate synthase, partial [Longimicrobiales bacterium]